MPHRSLFEKLTSEQIRGTLREAKAQARRTVGADYTQAIDFLEGRQKEHVTSELSRRYKHRQSNSKGQTLQPVTIPLTQRYIAEAATAYNRPVTRKVVSEDGSVNEPMTEELNKQLSLIGYNEKLHRIEELQEVVGDVGLWFQVKAGRLRPVIVLPQDVYPVFPDGDDAQFCDPTDQTDYSGFVVQVLYDLGEEQVDVERLYAYLTPAETIFYNGKREDPFEPTGPLTHFANTFTWPQLIDTPDHRGSEQELPLQPLVIWHKRVPVDGVLSFPDADIVTANLELNIQWTLLLDTMRSQGWATPVLNLLDPNQSDYALVPHGALNPVTVEVGESFSYASAAPPFEGLMSALRSFVSMIAIAHRQSPNDFSIEGAAPASGFAKLVDSLPKLEARGDRISRLKQTEEQHAWPRIASIGAFLGWDGFTQQSIRNTQLRVEYSDLEFPKTVDEEIKRSEFALKHKMTTPADLLAKKKDITKEEAEELIAANKEASPDPAPEQQQQQPNRGLLGGLIGQRRPLQ